MADSGTNCDKIHTSLELIINAGRKQAIVVFVVEFLLSIKFIFALVVT